MKVVRLWHSPPDAPSLPVPTAMDGPFAAGVVFPARGLELGGL